MPDYPPPIIDAAQLIRLMRDRNAFSPDTPQDDIEILNREAQRIVGLARAELARRAGGQNHG